MSRIKHGETRINGIRNLGPSSKESGFILGPRTYSTMLMKMESEEKTLENCPDCGYYSGRHSKTCRRRDGI